MKAVTQSPESPLPIDDLDKAIVGLSARINAATYELLVMIRQFDERAGWLRWGLLNCTGWLHWRCDLSMNAAREKVRVAHAIKTLPAIAAAFANRSLRVHRNVDRGTTTLTVELPSEMGEVVEKALDKARDDSVSSAEFVDESWSARQADALLEVANAYLATGKQWCWSKMITASRLASVARRAPYSSLVRWW